MVSISINFEDFDKSDFKSITYLAAIPISTLLVAYTLWSSFPSTLTYLLFSIAALFSPLSLFYFYTKRPDDFEKAKFIFSAALFIILLTGSYHITLAQNSVPEKQVSFDFDKENLTIDETYVEVTQRIHSLDGYIEIDVENEPGRIEFDENECLDLKEIEGGKYIRETDNNETVIELTDDDFRANISCQGNFEEYDIDPDEGSSELDLDYPKIVLVGYNIPYGPMVVGERDIENRDGTGLDIDLRHQQISLESEQNDEDLTLRTYPKYSLYNKLLSLFSLLIVGLSVTLIESFFDSY